MTKGSSISPFPRLLFSDLDRTFLAHDYTVHPRAAAAVTAAQHAGLDIIFVSARAPQSLLKVVGPLGVTGCAACFNGGWIGNLSSGETIYANRLPVELAAAIADDALSRGADLIWYGDGEIFVRSLTPAVIWQLAKVGEQATVVPDFAKLSSGPFKLLCVDQRLATCFENLQDRWLGDANLVQSHPVLLEVNPVGVSKGDAVEQLMEVLSLTARDCAAVGDAENDVSMLERVGLPATVANAIDPIKQIAQCVGASCDEGGFADVVDWLLRLRASAPNASHAS